MDPKRALPPPQGSVAVVFIHGMGEQRRYADTSILASRLAAYARSRPDFGGGANVDPEIALEWNDGKSAADPRPRARAAISAVVAGVHVVYHEVYWAPLVAGQTNFRSLFRWLRGRAWQPFWYLCARWASHAQLKLDVLQEDHLELSAVEHALVDAYAAFVTRARNGDDANDGSFGAFLGTLAEGREPAEAEALRHGAVHWFRRYVGSLVWALVRSTPPLVAITAGALAVPLTAAWIVGRLVPPPPHALDWVFVSVASIAWLLAFWLARFLVRSLGDVEVYATYNEASERNAAREAVVRQATEILRVPLTNPAIARVVVVAHSLGSVVAWDAVRALALEAQVGESLRWSDVQKLSRVITYGSPVDKIRFYHFADDLGDPTFRSILETLKVDTSFGRFAGGLAWDNYYDPADLIGGRLESPNDPHMRFPVRNVAVKNGVIANPYHGHVGYLSNPRVLEGIVGAIRGEARPQATRPPDRYGRRAWATTLELLGIATLVAWFLVVQLGPILGGATVGSPIAWLAIVLLIALLACLA